MKKILASLFLATAFLSLNAQQVPLYSSYFFAPYLYNPARSGVEGSTEAMMLHRRQWTGIQGSPETSVLGVNGSRNGGPVGWSVLGYSDRTSILNRLGLYGNYSYAVKLSQDVELGFGLGAGYYNQQIDQSAVRTRDAGDAASLVPPNRGTFDINAGINLKFANFSIGASSLQLLAPSVEYASEFGFNTIRHFVFNAQYDIKIGGDKSILSPMVLVRTAEIAPPQIDVGAMFNLVEYGYVGAMLRTDYALIANAGFNLSEQLTLGYAYDFSTNEFASQFGNSHEFMLIYRFGSNRDNERMENELKRLKMQQTRQRNETEDLVNEKLDEFKDRYKGEMQEALEEEKKKMQEEVERLKKEAPSRGSSQSASSAGTGSNQGSRSNAGSNQQSSGQNQSQGQLGGSGYPSANEASNVEPGTPGYYVTAGVFSQQANAQGVVNRLAGQGLNARIYQDPSNNFFYVYLLKFDSYQEADQAKASKLNGRFNGDLWIKVVE